MRKKITLFILSLILATSMTFAQKVGVKPKVAATNSISNLYNQGTYVAPENPISANERSLLAAPNVVRIAPVDVAALAIEDRQNDSKGVLTRSAQSIPVNQNMISEGTWSYLSNGNRVCRLKLGSIGASAIVLAYNSFKLPANSRLYLYNETGTQIVGPITSENNPLDGYYSTEMIQGDMVTLEYIEDKNFIDVTKPSTALINIESLGYVYRDAEIVSRFAPTTRSTGWGQSETCEVNVNCPEGTNWQKQKRGVAEIFVYDGSQWGWCSGDLVNNTSNNGTPYFLTADHCGGGSAANIISQWQFYFKFEAPSCTTPGSAPAYITITGATKKARGNMTGGTDFLLLLLNSTPGSNCNPYYNGWDRTNTASPSGVSIHHPAGDIKKISTYSTTLTTASYSGCAASSHWQVTWAQTATNRGVTEGGSSGSPIFNSAGLQVGTLTGGSSYCATPTSPDMYGKFFKHWDANGTTSDLQLKPWLDPTNTGATTCIGYDPYAAAAAPVSEFSANSTSIYTGGQVTFSDLSTNVPTSWAWTVTPSTGVTYLSSTSATSQNPVMSFANAGQYTITLRATNTYGAGNLNTKTNYITVTTAPLGTTCDTVWPSSFSGACLDSITVYIPDAVSPADSGYLTGCNAYKDKEKAMKFVAPVATTISDVFVLYALKAGTTGTTTVKIYGDNGGIPGTLLGTSAAITKANIDTTNQGLNYNNKYHFTTPISVSGTYYVSVVLPTTWTNGTNELAIWSENISCSTGSQNAGYEYWNTTGTTYAWASFLTNYGVNIDMAIIPVTGNCTSPVSVTTSANPTTICKGATSQLTATPSGGTTYTYAWSPSTSLSAANIANPVATPSVSTTYFVTVTSGGQTATSSVAVIVTPLPTANAGNDKTICSGTSTTLTATGGGTYAWSNSGGSSATTIALSPTTVTTYTVTVTSSGCSASDAAVVYVNTSPTANAGNDATICSGTSTTLTATGGGTYAWSNSGGSSATTISLSPTTTTTYTVTVTSSGCNATDAAVVIVNATPTANAGNDKTICEGASTTLTATGGGSYAWSNNGGSSATTSSLYPTTTTTYTVTVSNSGCSATDIAVVNVNPLPTVNAGNDATICTGQSVDLAATGTNVTTYTWTGQSAGALYTVTPTTTTTYIVAGTNNCGSISDNVVVTVSTVATVNAGSDVTICAGQSATLAVSAASNTTYAWNTQPVQTTPSISVNPSTTTTYTVSSTSSCGVASDNVVVFVNSAPTISAGNDATICAGSSTTLTASGGGNYLWNNNGGTNATTIALSPSQTTTYTVTVTSSGCSASDAAVVYVNAIPTSTFSVNPTTVAQGVPATITYTGTASSGATYNWGFNGGNVASGSGQGPYSVSWANVNVYNITLSVTENNCTSTVTTTPIDVTINIGLTEVNSSSFKMYPNPANNELTIELNGTYSNNSTIVVYNMIGEAVLKSNINSSKQVLDLNNLSNGTYYISVNNGEKLIKDKFIIVK
ncbi:MAG: T9SS type A sorting domain-containing protein [Bacteroidota bacterium]